VVCSIGLTDHRRMGLAMGINSCGLGAATASVAARVAQYLRSRFGLAADPRQSESPPPGRLSLPLGQPAHKGAGASVAESSGGVLLSRRPRIRMLLGVRWPDEAVRASTSGRPLPPLAAGHRTIGPAWRRPQRRSLDEVNLIGGSLHVICWGQDSRDQLITVPRDGLTGDQADPAPVVQRWQVGSTPQGTDGDGQ
jgi:hypothetical protein